MLTLSNPGHIDNSDFACMHGGVLPTRGLPLADVAVEVRLKWQDGLHMLFLFHLLSNLISPSPSPAEQVSLPYFQALRDKYGCPTPPPFACVGICAVCRVSRAGEMGVEDSCWKEK